MAITEEELEDNKTPIEILGQLLLFLLVFGMSATVSIENLAAQLKNRRAIATGVFLQFFVLPLLGFITVKVLHLQETMGIMLLVVTSSPGGSYSNWWCSLFNADLALSVTMTTISTLLSVVMLPANLLLYANNSFEADVVNTLDWEALFESIFIVVLAISLGLLTSAKVKVPNFSIIANKIGNMAGVMLVLFSFAVTSGDTENDLIGRPWDFYVAVAAPCIVGCILSTFITSEFDLRKPERVTVSVECCYQNVGIATSVGLTMFKGDDLAEALGVPVYYGIVEAVVLGVFCIIAWKAGWTKAPPSDPFTKVIAHSYENEPAAAPSREEYESIIT